jgi:hypothetical protein
MVTVLAGFLMARQIVDLREYDEWQKAMDQEHESLQSPDVWMIEKHTELEHPLGTRGILARKKRPGCEPKRERYSE